MSEILFTQLILMLSLPGSYINYGGEYFGYWIFLYLAAWTVIGCIVGRLLLVKFQTQSVFILWVSIWFLPGTIICGSAAIVPWVLLVGELLIYNQLDIYGDCSGIITLGINLSVNVVIATLATKFFSRYRIVKA